MALFTYGNLLAWRCSISLWTQETEHLQNMLVMDYICTFQVYLWEVSERLSVFIKRNHVSIWNWIQKYKPKKIPTRRKKVSEFILDETVIKVGSEFIWLWVAIEPKNRAILALSISKERNMFVIAERFLYDIVKEHGKCPV